MPGCTGFPSRRSHIPSEKLHPTLTKQTLAKVSVSSVQKDVGFKIWLFFHQLFVPRTVVPRWAQP